MAKQAGDFFIEGTIDDLTFYKMEGKYYVRMKSSLTGKKFWKHKAFERSRESCKRFSEGNRLASNVYRMIEEDKKDYKLFCFLKKTAILLLKEGKSLVETEAVLIGYLKPFKIICEKRHKISSPTKNQGLTSISFNHQYMVRIDSITSIDPMKKITKAVYACAVGPPKVMGICISSKSFIVPLAAS